MRFHKLTICSFAVLVLSVSVAVAQTSQPKHQLDVPYVPTTDEAVKAMLKLADGKKTDIVYVSVAKNLSIFKIRKFHD